MNITPKKSQLQSREEAIRIAALYPAGLKDRKLRRLRNTPFNCGNVSLRERPVDGRARLYIFCWMHQH